MKKDIVDIVDIVAANQTALEATLKRLAKRRNKQCDAAFETSGMLELNARHRGFEHELRERQKAEEQAWMDDDTDTMEDPRDRHWKEERDLGDSLWPERDRVQTHHQALRAPIDRRYALAVARARIKAARDLVASLGNGELIIGKAS